MFGDEAGMRTKTGPLVRDKTKAPVGWLDDMRIPWDLVTNIAQVVGEGEEEFRKFNVFALQSPPLNRFCFFF